MFEIVANGHADVYGYPGDSTVTAMIRAESGSHKIVLPRRSGEFPFAPRQYFYPASKSGVVPSFALSGSISLLDDPGGFQRAAA